MIRTLLLLPLLIGVLPAIGETGTPPSITANTRMVADLRELKVAARSADAAQAIEATFVWDNSHTATATLSLPDNVQLIVKAHAAAGTDGLLRLKTTASASGKGSLERLSLHLPLRLEDRQRVIQAGENDLTWETRTRYHFTTPMNSIRELLPQPDVNIWRIFRSEWKAGDTYTLSQAESGSTAPLIQHHGTGFPGWIAVYDQKGGLAAGLEAAEFNTERALQVETEKGGTLQIDLHPASAPALRISDQWQDELTLRFLSFVEPPSDLGARLARNPKRSGPPSDLPSVVPAPVLPVSGGIPLARGVLHAKEHVHLRSQSGTALPLQTAPLAYWPDGSIKWLEVIFPREIATTTSDPTEAEEALAAFHVSDGTGQKEAYTLRRGQAPLQKESRVEVRRNGKELTVRTGPLEATLAPGAKWWPSLRVDGQPVFTNEAGATAYLELTQMTAAPTRSGKSSGLMERNAFTAETITVEEEGPQRAVIKLEGATGGKHSSRITLRLAFYAGAATIQGWHTWVVGSWDPREWFVTGLGLEFPLSLPAAKTQITAQEGSEALSTPLHDGVKLTAFHPDAVELAVEEKEQSRRLGVGPEFTNALDLRAPDRGVVAILRDMRKLFPASITTRPLSASTSSGVNLRLEFWPSHTAPMDLRRYSDLPHRGQGESVPTTHNWVQDHFYLEDPVRGVSRTHEFLLVPWAQTAPPLAPLAAALEDRPLIVTSEQTYLKTGILTDDLTPASLAPVRENLERFAEFLDFHRRKWRWYGKWNYGDIQHYYRGGYGRKVDADVLAQLLQNKQKQLPRGAATVDYVPQNDWAYDNGRWGWTNTEGLPNRYLTECYLRTGNRSLFFAIEALARHSRDVIIRHEGRFFGGGTRHGVQPWSDGNHEQRTTIPSEWRLHRLLTGEKRSRDVLLRHGYDVFLQPKSQYVTGGTALPTSDADHSARLYGLLTLWEATGDPHVADSLQRYIGEFLLPQGVAGRVAIKFPEIRRVGAPVTVNSGSMFFQTFGAVYALSEYFALTGDERLRQHMEQMAAHAISEPKYFINGRFNSSHFYWPTIAFAARYAQDSHPYRDFIAQWLKSPPGAVVAHQMTTRNRAHWSGPSGFMASRTMPGALFYLNVLPSLVAPLGALPAPTDTSVLERNELEGGPPSKQPSWQNEYDRPELQDYLSGKEIL